ncbi:hypothetical protein RCIP0033_00060 [Klebsiella phage RCIP0033]
MSNITLTIPNDDHIALRAFGKALEEMALAHGAEPRKTVGELSYKLNIDTSEALERLRAATETLQQAAPQTMGEPEVDTTAQQVESLAALDNDLPIITVNPTCHALSNEELQERGFDSTGTPWDERIHSTSKALNADGTWRLRRKPKDMDEAQWTALIESVKNELMGVDAEDLKEFEESKMATPEPPVTPPGDEGSELQPPLYEIAPGHIGVMQDEPPVTPPGDDFHADADVVTEQTVAGIPPLPVPPPVVVAPPVTEWDFPRLMTFLTERHGKIDVATVNTLLAQDGMSSVQELNAHPDKIGPFVARVKVHLGE